MTTNSTTDSEKQELEKLRQFREEVWKIACACRSDWMIIELADLEVKLQILKNKWRGG